jgi:ArsR family transcriptional regulator
VDNVAERAGVGVVEYLDFWFQHVNLRQLIASTPINDGAALDSGQELPPFSRLFRGSQHPVLYVEDGLYLYYSATMQVVQIEPSTLFQALADDTRLRVIRLLATADEEACLCELVDSLQEPAYKLSRHLKILRLAGLLSAHKDGRWVYHRLVKEPAHLDKLTASVNALPDPDEQFRRDLMRFVQRMRLRKDGRCRVGTQPEGLETEA